MDIGRFALFLALAVACTSAQPSNIALTPFTTTPDAYAYGGFGGVAVDEATGKVYFHAGYEPQADVLVYANATAFMAQTPESSVTLAGGGFFGTYFQVDNGKIFGRTSNSDSSTAVWNGTTGALITNQSSFPSMGGANVADTFDWGGYSGVNFMQDSTGLYVVGHVSGGGGNWQVLKIDSSLNILSTETVDIGAEVGYGFIIGGNLFTSNFYDSDIINEETNLSTGIVSAVNFTLTGDNSPYSPYWDNVSYDYSNDVLYFSDVNSGEVYSVSGAASKFGVAPAPNAIPEPGPISLLCIGMLAFATAKRRRRDRPAARFG